MDVSAKTGFSRSNEFTEEDKRKADERVLTAVKALREAQAELDRACAARAEISESS